MSNKINKPKKRVLELIDMLKNDKGITFIHMSEIQAKNHLQKKNNYLRTVSYRKNYDKYGEKEKCKPELIGKYKNLDFSYLVELSLIDMYLRNQYLKMCIDIEHSLKIILLEEIENNPKEDGYEIVSDFLAKECTIRNNIAMKVGGTFCGDLIASYFTIKPHTKNPRWYEIDAIDCPAWVLLECLSFGDTLKFYRYYYEDKYSRNTHINIQVDKNLLYGVRSLRNACAHNNCLLNGLGVKTNKPNVKVSQFVSSIKGIGEGLRTSQLSIKPLYEIVSMLMVYDQIVTSKVREHGIKCLFDILRERTTEKKDFFIANDRIKSAYKFLYMIVDHIH